jgi:phosphoribosyl 1,2-cyclic phosphodiesterase
VALAHDGASPTLVLDGGTGLRRLSDHLEGRPFRGTIALGHLHWDHTHGLPFFASGNHPESDVTVVLPLQDGDRPLGAEQMLERMMSPPHFPITPSQLGGRWRFEGIEPGRHRFEGFDVLTLEIPHKGGRTFGFRVSDGTSSLAYLSDHSPLGFGPGPDGLGEYHPAATALVAGVDVVIHDAQHTADQFPGVAYLGHAAVEYAVGLAEAAEAKRLVLFHHDPGRTDDQIDAIVAGHQGRRVEVIAAHEGLILDL